MRALWMTRRNEYQAEKSKGAASCPKAHPSATLLSKWWRTPHEDLRHWPDKRNSLFPPIPLSTSLKHQISSKLLNFKSCRFDEAEKSNQRLWSNFIKSINDCTTTTAAVSIWMAIKRSTSKSLNQTPNGLCRWSSKVADKPCSRAVGNADSWWIRFF